MTREEGQEILITAFVNNKYMPVSYLTATYPEYDLNRLLDIGTLSVMNLERAIADKRTKEFGYTEFQAFQVKSFIEGQLSLVAKAYKHSQTNFECTTLEGDCFEIELCAN